MINPFEPLGISPTLSEDEVRRAYHEKARRVHPDQFPDGPEQDAATRKMILLNQAYEEAMALVKSRSVSPYLLTLPCEDAVELANRLLKQNSPDRALRQLMRAENRNASWYDAQGRVMMALEQYRTAEESFREAVHLDPGNIAYRRGALDAHTEARKAASLRGRVRKLLHIPQKREHEN